jgi:hypothetical protein
VLSIKGKQMLANEYNGFATFADVEDKELQAFNRGRVLCNMYVDNSENGKTNDKGFALIVGYFNRIPVAERASAQDQFLAAMKKEGLILAS